MTFENNTDFFKQMPFGLTIGPQRSGTTWMDSYFRGYQDVCMPYGVKETFYFDRNYHKGLGYYEKQFKPEPQHKIMVEVSATAFHHPDAPQRVFDLFGKDVKLLCPLRHPVPRSYSLYRHFLQYGMVKGTLDDAIEQRPDIVTSSLYATHLRRWFDVFGEENVPVIFLEELREDPASFTQKLCAAFDIEFLRPFEDKRNRAQNANYAVRPPNVALARLGQAVADRLRENGAYEIINLAKKAGLKRVFFGTDKREEDVLLKVQEHEILNTYLEGEISALESTLGIKIPLWRDYKLDIKEINTPSTEAASA